MLILPRIAQFFDKKEVFFCNLRRKQTVLRKYVYILILLLTVSVYCQKTSNLSLGKKWQHISFKFINNLIILPLELNGIKGDFILDTGVKGNILFLGDNRNFQIKDSLRTVNIRGFGYGEPIKAYVSIGNKVQYKKLVLLEKDFFLLKDEKLNFSAKTGIPIHGLVGSDFFQYNVVKINYKKKRVTVYESEYYYKKKHKERKVEVVELEFHNRKPYLEGEVKIFKNDSTHVPVKLLIDTGGTEALWLFKDEKKFDILPPKYFTDFLGESLTGSIYGDKSRIDEFAFGGYDFGNPIVSFLDEDITSIAKNIKGRSGTLGAGILKRFTVWFDYRKAKIYLKKNSCYKEEFYYNMSGLEINYNGYVAEFRQEGLNVVEAESFVFSGYHFALKPSYIIANVRKGSPGDLGGLKEGDVILEIDYVPIHQKSYGDIIDHFYTRKNKKVDLLIDRDGKEMEFDFQLIDELD
jgi:hypothetical protein